ncbi:MoaD/ThiS family protein [Pelomicrobium sp.]|jgi:molybdopterin converting factor small subunit|uniref:MoaD/ThiS family protein n=1 Tax=Pelomicrobium sp. TaxID=2815319 RepID=UPI002FDEAF5E
MKVTLKLFAMLQDYLPAEARGERALELTLPEGTTVAAVVERFRLPEKLVHLTLVNGEYVEREARASRPLRDGDVLAIWPPVAGG